jgi:predicted secreted hydrolase
VAQSCQADYDSTVNFAWGDTSVFLSHNCIQNFENLNKREKKEKREGVGLQQGEKL